MGKILKKLLKFSLYTVCGLAGVYVLLHLAFFAMMLWHTFPRSYDPGNSEFAMIAISPLESFAGNKLPQSVRVVRYFKKENFNDGTYLWLLELDNPAVLPELVALLKLTPASPEQHVPKFEGWLPDPPEWVERPRTDMKWLYIDDGTRCNGCSPRQFLWSLDGKKFYLSHVYT